MVISLNISKIKDHALMPEREQVKHNNTQQFMDMRQQTEVIHAPLQHHVLLDEIQN